MLKDNCDALSRRIDNLAIDKNVPGAWRQESTDASEQSRLAATRGADNAEDLVASHRQLDVAKGDDRSFEEEFAGVVNYDFVAIGHSTRPDYSRDYVQGASLSGRGLSQRLIRLGRKWACTLR